METSNILVNAEESTHATDEIKLLILAVFIIILIITCLNEFIV